MKTIKEYPTLDEFIEIVELIKDNEGLTKEDLWEKYKDKMKRRKELKHFSGDE